MPRRKVPLVAGDYYHLHNRGNNRQTVFYNRKDYILFLDRIRKYIIGSSSRENTLHSIRSGVTISAYCLMPNHYHLLLTPHDDDLSHRMQLLSISFTKTMNQKHNRVGSLFQGQFQATPIVQDTHLIYLSAYIHLNPVRAGLVQQADEWPFSSYREYIDLRQGSIPSPNLVVEYISGIDRYQEFVESFTDQHISLVQHLLLEEM